MPASASAIHNKAAHSAMCPKLNIQPKLAERLLWGNSCGHVNDPNEDAMLSWVCAWTSPLRAVQNYASTSPASLVAVMFTLWATKIA